MVPRIPGAPIFDHDAVRLMLLVRVDARRSRLAVQGVGERLYLVAVGEECPVSARAAIEQRDDHVPRRPAPLHDLQVFAEPDQLLELLLQVDA